MKYRTKTKVVEAVQYYPGIEFFGIKDFDNMEPGDYLVLSEDNESVYRIKKERFENQYEKIESEKLKPSPIKED